MGPTGYRIMCADATIFVSVGFLTKVNTCNLILRISENKTNTTLGTFTLHEVIRVL